MKLFVSYPSEQNDLAERLRLALEAEGHDVFTDRAELRAGEGYHAALRDAIADADALVFLITPRSVAAGSYTLTELGEAERRWRRPAGRVLPVVIAPTPLADVPPYLKAVTLLQPRGDAVAETVAAVARLRGSGRRGWIAAAALAVAVAAGGGLWWQAERRTEQARAADAAERRLSAQVAAAMSLCAAGNPQAGLDALATLAPAERSRAAAADCAMRWLRDARVRVRSSEGGGFGPLVDRAAPVVAAALPDAAKPQRRADLQAHLGWAEFLLSREAPAADPLPLYDAALALDGGNVYALAMRAHWRAWRGAGLDDPARADFERAVASGRERSWVRRMQWGAATRMPGNADDVVRLADAMRQGGEVLDEDQRSALWSRVDVELGNGRDSGLGPRMLVALPPERWVATLDWAFAPGTIDESRVPRVRFARALLRLGTPERREAVAELRALRAELVAADRYATIVGQIDRVLSGETPLVGKR